MPEGDTVWRTAQRLTAALAGQPLRRAELRWGDLDAEPLRGLVTREVVSRGKHLLHRLDGDVTVHSHLRMEGMWRVVRANQVSGAHLRHPQVRAVLGTDHWTCLGLRLGMLHVGPTAQESQWVGHLGPDVLGSDWDRAEALRRLQARPDREVGAGLLDQRNLAGIGTFYCSEALFLERLNPWARIGDLTQGQLAAAVDRARQLLLANRGHAVPATTGRRRRGEEAYVHARSGLPCRRCADTIRVSDLGDPPQQRAFFSCPTCQGGMAPDDDGRPQRPLGAARRRRGGPSA